MRTFRSLAFALPLLLLAACGAQEPLATSATAIRAAAPALAGGNKVVGVMSRNLYLGAELGPVIQAQGLPQFLGATTAVWAMVERNDFHLRAQAVANEIAAARPALVGLQEAYTWWKQGVVQFDYVPELVGALAERGVGYRPVISVPLFTFDAPILTGETVRMQDHLVILAREDVTTANPEGAPYPDPVLLPLTVLGTPLLVQRGWATVDVKYRGEWIRFATTHLEAYDPRPRVAQAQVLVMQLAGVAAKHGPLPEILVGDLNSHPGEEGEAILAAAGFEDAWPVVHPDDPGLSCCWLEDLTIGSPPAPPFYERIDYVLTRGLFEPRTAAVTGSDPASRVGGLWPSDHGGLEATLRIGDPRFAP
jgi:endonuclease/exonuclease/phosphatase family metal-dependent hydrolase